MSAKPTKVVDKFEILTELGKELSLVDDSDYETKSEAIPSGSLTLDLAIGIGGLPRGGIVNIYGPESSGKSLISIMAIASIQKSGGVAVIWDLERSYSKNLNWLRVNGVDTSRLKFIRLKPGVGAEKGFDIIERILKANAADLIIVDSCPAILPQDALDKEMTESAKVAANAGLLSRAIPRLVNLADDSKTCVIFIDQLRSNMMAGPYAPPEKETTIWSLKFFSSVRLSVRRVSKSEKVENDVPVGHRVHIKVIKNKVASPGRQAEFEINYLHGVDNASEIADILVEAGVVKQSAAWFEYDGQRLHGLKGVVEFFKDKDNYAKGLKIVKSLTNINAFGVKKIGEPNENKEELAVESEDQD